jgi:hypothetical protein
MIKISIMIFVLCGNSVFGQNLPGPKKARTLDDYQPRTLKEVVTIETAVKGSHEGEDGIILHGNILPSRVRVIYKGLTRPLPHSKKEVIIKWARQFAGFPEFYTKPYETEILFIEDGREYWLAVKKDLVPQLGKELKDGEAVDLYVIRLGGVRTADELEYVILTENYKKVN